MTKNFLNSEGHQNPISGSKVTAILLKGWILPVSGASSGRVCVCSLRSRLVSIEGAPQFTEPLKWLCIANSTIIHRSLVQDPNHTETKKISKKQTFF